MNMLKRNLTTTAKCYVAVAALSLCLVNQGLSAGRSKAGTSVQAETAAILAAAQPEFDSLLDEAESAKPSFGFDADDNLHDVVMGDPMPVYTVSEDNACEFCDGDKVESVLKQSGQWLIPLTINGTLRTFIKVTEVSDNNTNKYVARLGSVSAAKVWRVILDRWPPQKNFHPKLVMYPGIPGYFFTIPEIDPQNMTDIVRVLAEVDKPTPLSPAAVIIHSWQ